MQGVMTLGSSTQMKVFDTLILLTAFVFNTAVLGDGSHEIIVAVGGSFSGSVILAYFRRDSRKLEQLFKVAASTIGGFVLGTVSQEYFQLTNVRYQLGLFFCCGMLSLAFLRALLSITERNAAQVCKDVISRLFLVKLETRARHTARRRVKRLDDGRFITLPKRKSEKE